MSSSWPAQHPLEPPVPAGQASSTLCSPMPPFQGPFALTWLLCPVPQTACAPCRSYHPGGEEMRWKRVVCSWPQLPPALLSQRSNMRPLCTPLLLLQPPHLYPQPLGNSAAPPIWTGLSLSVMPFPPTHPLQETWAGESCATQCHRSTFPMWSLTVSSLRGVLTAASPLEGAPRGLSLSLAADLGDQRVAACLSDKTTEVV